MCVVYLCVCVPVGVDVWLMLGVGAQACVYGTTMHHKRACECMYVLMYVCIYVCMYVCMCMYVRV